MIYMGTESGPHPVAPGDSQLARSATPQVSGGSKTPLKVDPILSIHEQGSVDEVYLGFDAANAYIATRSTIWRADLSLSGMKTPERVSVGVGEVHALFAEQDGIYVLKDAGGDIRNHTLLRSRDGCRTFESLDEGLVVDEAGAKVILAPTSMTRIGKAIFTNAGGGQNFLVSTNEGRSWTALKGSLGNQACYPGKFLIMGTEVILGGECPLDEAYLTKGTLSEDFSGWCSAPQPVAPWDIANRNVQFVRHLQVWDVLLAGVEGGLLASRNRGQRWDWLMQFPLGRGSYPYIKHCSPFPALGKGVIVGGFDKANDNSPYLALCSEQDDEWVDVSEAVRACGSHVRHVSTLACHPDGRLIIATYDTSDERVVLGVLTAR